MPPFFWRDSSDGQTCTGKFANPITDICWSCILPITIGAATVATLGQEDIENPASPLCVCPGVPTRLGVSIGFWEPARQVDVTRKPFCLVSLGGMSLNPGLPAPRGRAMGAHHRTRDRRFYQAHWYANPMLYWLEVLLDFPCLESGGFDLAYLTEVDPLWKDDELTTILNPDAMLFANPIALAACAADCVAATWASASRSSSGALAARAASIRSTATSPHTSAAYRPRC